MFHSDFYTTEIRFNVEKTDFLNLGHIGSTNLGNSVAALSSPRFNNVLTTKFHIILKK